MKNKTKLSLLLFMAAAVALPMRAAGATPDEWAQKIAAEDLPHDPQAALLHGDQALTEHPEDVGLLVFHATNLVAFSQPAKAIPLLKAAIERASKTGDHLPPYAYRKLGEACFSVGKYDDASAALERGAKEPRDQQRVLEVGNLFGTSDAYRGWEIVETEHLRFHFSPEFPKARHAQFTESREKAYVTVNEFWKATLPKKIDFIVWTSTEEAKKVAGIKSLGFARPEYALIHSRANQTRGHEITHVLTHYAAKALRRTKFVNEGIAVSFDLTQRDRLAEARAALKRTRTPFVPIKQGWELSGSEFTDDPWYPVAGAWMERLRKKGGDEQLRRLCADQGYTNALSIYGPDLEKWIIEFEQDLGQNAAAEADGKTTPSVSSLN